VLLKNSVSWDMTSCRLSTGNLP